MSVNLPTFFVQQFATNVQLLLQQKGSKLRGTVTEGTYVGKQASPVDQIGAVEANKVTGRFQPMGRVDAALDRRWVFPTDYDLPQLIDTFDKLRMIVDPESSYVTNAVYALGRRIDDEIISAFTASAKTGETAGTTTTIIAGNTVSVNTGGTASNLNTTKIRAGKQILEAAQVDLDTDPIYMAITSKEHASLLNEIQIVSTDYNDRPVLVDGRVRNWLGVNFVMTERLLAPASGDDQSGTSNSCPMWAKSGMHLGVWNDVETSVSKRNDLQGEPWQVYAKGTFGATRLEEKKIVRIWCR